MRDEAQASREYLKDIKGDAGWIAHVFEGCLLQDVTTEKLRALLKEKAHVQPRTRRGIVQTWIMFFNAAIDAKHLKQNPAKDVLPHSIERTRANKIKRRKPPGILTVDDIRRFFKKAESSKPDFVAGFALTFFAGLRTEELSQMRWEYIDTDSQEIDLKAHVTKTGEHRFIAMQPNLVEWVKRYGQLEGSLFPGSSEYANLRRYERARLAVCKGAEIRWVHNAGRHSFASYHFRYFANELETFTQTGHDNVAVFRAHYKNIVRNKSDAAKYWEIRPSGDPPKNQVRPSPPL
jgi:integrase